MTSQNIDLSSWDTLHMEPALTLMNFVHMINVRGSYKSHSESIISPHSIHWDVAVMETRYEIWSSHGGHHEDCYLL
jgi:hypothetical protein